MKQLKDMNLVDDFLAYSLTVHKTYGEEASRYILECILQRKICRLTVVPQKPWPGETPEKHGIRLDVYLDEEDGEIFDIEPDNNSSARDINALPRRVRFYHAKIDSGNLASGEDYSALRNVYCALVRFAVQPDCRPPAKYFPGNTTVNPGGLQYNCSVYHHL